MGKTEIPKGLPKCELIEQLARKARERTDTKFDFLGTLERFRTKVSGEVQHVVQVFPEFTPHDEEHHLTPLFHAADKLLEKKRLTGMNSVELMILAVGLYGHDWGMAVSDRQKECIIRGELPEDSELEELWVSRKERRWLGEFARQHRIFWDSNEGFVGVGADLWREYVRETHALRSGERVRRFFEKIDGGLGHAGGRVCEAHCLSFEELRHADSYPVDFALLGETANLRALAVYVRLVDLFDLSEARTPYVIWKFVAPRDPRSKMEWEKHRAVHSVTFPTHQEGRVVHVEGSTDDHEAYAALEDLRHKCDDELRGCGDILDRMRDPRHALDLYGVSWRVSAIGFEPVSIQFEFDRDQMFEILSDEIYQGDPYVFLRELLQNSIDAIRMRREVLERRGPGAGNVGVIRVTVDHAEDGDAIVTWRDDGIGMDEYIVRNYLAVAGKSYYRSVDFEREGLEMDPISRFGIGLLSCFMVANGVDIETYRDPYLYPRGDPLSIKIPAMRRQFRIERRPQEGAKYGTTVRVFVEGSRLPTDEHGAVEPLDVTEYLATVAGFVDFPILLTDGDRKIIILHPRQDGAEARNRLELGEDWEVRQLDLSYPWSELFLAQDVPLALELLQQERCELLRDLQLEGYDGVLAYVTPRGHQIEAVHASTFGDTTSCTLVTRGEDQGEWPKMVRYPEFRSDDVVRPVVFGPSSHHPPMLAVYRDGILLASASPPNSWSGTRAQLPSRFFVVNLPKSIARKVDLGRTALVEQRQPWDVPIFEAHLRYVLDNSLSELLALDPADRLYRLGRLVAYDGIPAARLWEAFPQDRWPVAFLEAGGCLRILEWPDAARDVIHTLPLGLERAVGKVLWRRYVAEGDHDGPLVSWHGEPCLLTPGSFFAVGVTLEGCASVCWVPVEDSYVPGDVRFLSPPWEDGPPLLQRLWLRADLSQPPRDVEVLLEDVIENPLLVSPIERMALIWVIQSDLHNIFFAAGLSEFPEPFHHYFAYGSRELNLHHPATVRLLQVVAGLVLSKRRGSLPLDRLGRVQDSLQLVLRSRGQAIRSPDMWSHALRGLWSSARAEGLLEAGTTDDLVPTPDEFVPGTDSLAVLEQNWEALDNVQPFGQSLSRQR